MNLKLPSSFETLINQYASEAGLTVQQFAIQAIQEKIAEDREERVADQQDHAEWIAQLKAWSQSHPGGTHFVDDSRESIYGERGL